MLARIMMAIFKDPFIFKEKVKRHCHLSTGIFQYMKRKFRLQFMEIIILKTVNVGDAFITIQIKKSKSYWYQK